MILKHFITHPAGIDPEGGVHPPSLMVAIEKGKTTFETSYALPLGKSIDSLEALFEEIIHLFKLTGEKYTESGDLNLAP